MSNLSKIHLSPILLVTLIAVSMGGCVDDADRFERAQQYSNDGEYRAAAIDLKNILRSDPKNIEARALLGHVALQNGDSSTAIKELERARDLGATADQYMVSLARALMRDGRYDEVVKFQADSLADPVNKATLLALIGTADYERGDQPAAQRRFAAALNLVPDQIDALVGSSILAQKQGDPDAAERFLTQALQSYPNNAEILAALGNLQLSKNEHAQAESSFNKALENIEGTNKNSEKLLYTVGLIDALLAQGKNTEAQAVSSRLVETSAQHPYALFKAATADFAVGDYSGAISKAEQVITVAPAAEPPRFLAAQAALADGDTIVAAKHLQDIVNMNPSNGTARKLLANVRMGMGDPAEALALLEPMIAAGSDDAQLLTMAGTATLRSGDTKAGVALMERGMEIGSSDPVIALQAASDFLAAGEINRAIEVLEALPEADRVGHRDLLLVLALLRKGDEAGARARAIATVNDRPESPDAHRLLGGFHLAVGEFDLARSEFEKALELNPRDIAAVVNLAKIDIAEEKPEQAEARFQAVQDANPGNLIALMALAQLTEMRGDQNGSVELMEQARKANPDAVAPLLQLGTYYLRNGEFKLAEERATTAVRVEPSNAEAQALLGLVLLQDERPTESITHFEKAIAANPNLVNAHFHLGRALAAAGRKDASYASFQRAAEIDKEFFPARAALTSAAIERGDLNAALGFATDLVADYPERSEPLTLQAHVQTLQKNFSAALESYEKAAAILPSRSIAARVYQIQRELGTDKPWDKLEQWVVANPDDALARTMLATALMDNGMEAEAVSQYEQVMATEPSVRVAMTLARLDEKAGDLDSAATWLQQAIELDPKAIQARAVMTGLELKRGKLKTAKKMLSDLRSDHPDADELDILEGDVLLATGDTKGSIKAFDRALASQPSEHLALRRYQVGRQSGEEESWRVLEKWFSDHPGHINAGLQLAQDYISREWDDEAIDVYRKVLTTDPGNMVALNNIAWAYYERGSDNDLKLGLAAASTAYQKDSSNAAIADTYAWILLKDGQNKKAVEILSVISQSADVDPEIVYHHAAALNAVGRDAEAISVLDGLLASGSTFDSRDDAEVLRRRLSP